MKLGCPCRESRKSRHFGRDAEIQAMDGSQPVVQMLDSGHLPTRGFSSVDTHTTVVTPCCHPWTQDFGIPAERRFDLECQGSP